MSGASEKVLGWVKNGVPCYWKKGEPTPWNLGTSMEDATEEEVEWLGRETTRCVEVGAWEEVDSLYAGGERHITFYKIRLHFQCNLLSG